MLKTHFLFSLRGMRRRKGYALINIAGLAVGIAVCFLILLWVRHELSYDHFHEKSDRIYRALWDARFGDNEWTLPLVPGPLGETLVREFPEVEAVVRFIRGPHTLRSGDEYVIEPRILLSDSTFFDVFSARFLAGNHRTALSLPDAIVVTSDAAERYFSGEDPVGQYIELNSGRRFLVTAVVEPLPSNSHLQFDFVIPLHGLEITDQPWWTNWGSARAYTYFVLSEGADVGYLNGKLREYIERQNEEWTWYSEAGNYSRFQFQPLFDIHLRSHLQYELYPGGNITYVYLFSIIAFIILLLACINYVNLATAISLRRVREVGVRKALGSSRSALARQFFLESFVFVVIGIVLAVGLVELVLPAFNRLAGKELTTFYFGPGSTLLLLAGLAVVVGVLAGSYPALHLSSFRPVAALRGESEGTSGRRRLRSGLVVVQFVVSVVFILCTVVVFSQLRYIQSTELGFDKEQVLIVKGAGLLRNRHDAFIAEVEARPEVVSAAAGMTFPGQEFDSMGFTPEQPANYEQTSLSYVWIDPDYVDLLRIPVVEGRNFSREFRTDSTSFLINRAAVRALGWDQPVGKTLQVGNSSPGPVIGVVEDFHFESLHQEVKPLVFVHVQWAPSRVGVRLRSGEIAAGITSVQEVWEEFVRDRPFEYSFLDQDFDALYRNEQRVSQVFMSFSALAIFIACLGLFGLASFMAQERTKEIGVRKVLGASVAGIVGLLSKDVARLVLVACIIAAPVAYLTMTRWLEDFAYRIELSWWMFALAGLLALLIAFLTIGYQALKAAMADPVKALRYE